MIFVLTLNSDNHNFWMIISEERFCLCYYFTEECGRPLLRILAIKSTRGIFEEVLRWQQLWFSWELAHSTRTWGHSEITKRSNMTSAVGFLCSRSSTTRPGSQTAMQMKGSDNARISPYEGRVCLTAQTSWGAYWQPPRPCYQPRIPLRHYGKSQSVSWAPENWCHFRWFRLSSGLSLRNCWNVYFLPSRVSRDWGDSKQVG